jgi:cytochrome c-type biogenesis protein CcmE
MKRRHWIGIAVIILFIAYSAVTFSNSLTPYVTFDQAKAKNSTVQVRGILVDNKVMSLNGGKEISFRLRDEAGREAVVRYKGLKPDGLEQATGIVAIGRFNSGEFLAEKLLIKCPSKYKERLSLERGSTLSKAYVALISSIQPVDLRPLRAGAYRLYEEQGGAAAK